MAITFDGLSSSDFEGFCSELLHATGYVNVDWRKGTGFATSPADKGRDIVCDHPREEPDGSQHLERWFVDCKHFKRGVPPNELQNLLAWAGSQGARRPDHGHTNRPRHLRPTIVPKKQRKPGQPEFLPVPSLRFLQPRLVSLVGFGTCGSRRRGRRYWSAAGCVAVGARRIGRALTGQPWEEGRHFKRHLVARRGDRHRL